MIMMVAPNQGRLQDFSQGGARFLGTKNREKRNKKFTREARKKIFAPP